MMNQLLVFIGVAGGILFSIFVMYVYAYFLKLPTPSRRVVRELFIIAAVAIVYALFLWRDIQIRRTVEAEVDRHAVRLVVDLSNDPVVKQMSLTLAQYEDCITRAYAGSADGLRRADKIQYCQTLLKTR